AVVGYLVQHQVTTQQVELHELLARFLPTTPSGATDRAFQAVESALGGVVRHRGRLTAFGLPLFLWFSTRMFGGLRAALNEVFDTDERRPWPVAKLLDLAMVLGTGALLVLSGVVAAWEAGNAAGMSTKRLALALFLLWVYYTAYLFLLGGEVAETYDLMRMRRSQRVQLG